MIKRSLQEDIAIINIIEVHLRSTSICKSNANKYERRN